MVDAPRTGEAELLAQARLTIAQQAAELEGLRSQLANQRVAEELRAAIVLAASAGTIAVPVTHARLLEMIVETAAHVIGARAAALFLVDEATEELTFEVAIGPKAAEVKRFRVPLGHGIAGLVAASGQPMAVANASSDARHAIDIAQAVGYHPESILCAPLFYGDRVVGVLELLDKERASAFSAADMHTLGLFANQAAVAIEQSRTFRNLGPLIAGVLGSFGETAGSARPALEERATSFATRLEQDPAVREALDLASLVQEIAWRGEGERAACRALLRGFADYLRLRPEPTLGFTVLP